MDFFCSRNIVIFFATDKCSLLLTYLLLTYLHTYIVLSIEIIVSDNTNVTNFSDSPA